MPRITGNKDVLTETRGLLPYWTTREILDAEQHDDILQAIGDTFPRLESTACHCEAAIMALLCPHESDRTPIEIRTMFNPFKRAVSILSSCSRRIFMLTTLYRPAEVYHRCILELLPYLYEA